MRWQLRTRQERIAAIGTATLLLLLGMGLLADKRRFPPRASSNAFEFDRAERVGRPPGPALAVADDGRVWLPSQVAGTGARSASWPGVPAFTVEILAFPDADRIVSLGRLTEPEPPFFVDSIRGAAPEAPPGRRRFALTPRFVADLPPEGEAGEVQVRELPSGEIRWSATLSPVARMAVSESGRSILIGFARGDGAVWTMDPEATPLALPTDLSRTVALLSRDGRRLALVPDLTEGGAWRGEIWDLDERRVTTMVEGTAEMLLAPFPARPSAISGSGFAFEGDGRLFALADPLGPRVTVFDVKTGKSRVVRGYLLDAVGRRLAIHDPLAGTVRIVEPGPTLSDPVEIRGRPTASHACRGGRWLALSITESRESALLRRLLNVGEPRHAVLVLDVLSARTVLSVEVRSSHALAFSPRGTAFALLEGTGHLRVWKAK